MSRRCRARTPGPGGRGGAPASRVAPGEPRDPARRAQFAPTLLQPVPTRRSWHELRAAGSGNAKKSDIRELPTDRGRKRRKRAVVWRLQPHLVPSAKVVGGSPVVAALGVPAAGWPRRSAATRNPPHLEHDGVDGPSWTSGVTQGAKEGLGARRYDSSGADGGGATGGPAIPAAGR